jgi:hypothetical protein
MRSDQGFVAFAWLKSPNTVDSKRVFNTLTEAIAWGEDYALRDGIRFVSIRDADGSLVHAIHARGGDRPSA